jgi:hypothetical protein
MYGFSDEVIVYLNPLSADQNLTIDEQAFASYDISVENTQQKTNKLQKKQQHQKAEYTITDAYLRY